MNITCDAYLFEKKRITNFQYPQKNKNIQERIIYMFTYCLKQMEKFIQNEYLEKNKHPWRIFYS